MKCDAHSCRTTRLCIIFLIFGAHVLCEGKLEKRQIVSNCSVDEFKCSNGHCIDSTLACDGHGDCPDGSDETQKLCISYPTCPGYLFRCNYGACVNKNKVCNGKNDCVDGSDESSSVCKGDSFGKPNNGSACQNENEFRCKSGQCIDSTSICDGVLDCSDGSDETRATCKDNQCPEYSFRCKYGGCIDGPNKCDKVIQCPDGSDEEKCYNSATTAKPPTKYTTRPTSISQTTQTTQPNTKKKCVVPNNEGSLYSYHNSNENGVLSPGTAVNENQIVVENCKEGYRKSAPKNHMICTSDGSWITNSEKLCLKKCQPLTSASLDLKCTLNGKAVDCSMPSIPGTILMPKCKVTHSIANGGVESPEDSYCLDDGKWSSNLYTCVPNCGQPYIPNKPLILHGKEAKYGSAPWNVGIYRKDEHNNYEMICGGTLISQNLVVSAAHCFWVENSTDRIIPNSNSLYKIGVGKYTRDISVKDNDFTQIMNVGFIYLHDDYYGSSGMHANDIAIILLTQNVQLSDVVMPICVDWPNRYQVTNGVTGKVVGWGKTENGQSSPVLLEAFLPYIDQKTCRNMYTDDFKFFVTTEKFCAGSKLGQGVHQGDSGAGLTFVHTSGQSALHYLTGVTSVKDPKETDSIAVFTDVSYHITWVRSYYTNFTRTDVNKTRPRNRTQ